MTIVATLDSMPPFAGSTIWRLVAPHAKPLVVMNEGSFDPHCYCIHSVTGDVTGLTSFARHFGSIRLHGIQIPKRDIALHLGANIGAMARNHVSLLTAFQPRGPIHLIGWSAGAIVALEMAQQLRAQDRDVPLLVALDGAPCHTGGGLSPRDPRYILKLAANLPRWIRDDRTSDWSMAGIRTRLSQKLAARHGGGALQDVDTLDSAAVESVISRPGWSPAQKAFVHTMYKAAAAYLPQRYGGNVLAFETGTQPLFHLRQVGAAWQAIAENLEILPIRGNHSGLILEPTAGRLAVEIIRRLEAALTPKHLRSDLSDHNLKFDVQ